MEQELLIRSESKCELCGSEKELKRFIVTPKDDTSIDNIIVTCETCNLQLTDSNSIDINHWRCLNDSMWSPVSSVQVVSWRMLKALENEGWAKDLLDMMYLEDDILTWAESGLSEESSESELKHMDCNGVLLQPGDTVTLIKDLDVKGVSFIAKRGTAVRRISLDPYNAEHIEGRVNGQKIVILTKFVKKSK
ncbi:MAG: PhnA domain-containing protein [Spirochaetaceae bacterium]